MENTVSMALIWAILGGVLLVAEVATGTFVLLFFAISAFLVAILDLVGVHSFTAQIIIFGAGGTIGLLFLRKKLQDTFGKGADFQIDEQAVFVLNENVPARSEASINYQGAPWKAYNVSDQELLKGSQVTVVKVEGLKLHIRAKE